MRAKRSFFILVLSLLVLTCFHVSAVLHSWYWAFKWLDMIIHFFTAAWVFTAATWVYEYSSRVRTIVGGHSVYVFAFGIVVILGIFWEVFEFSFDTFIRFARHHPLDTASDLFFDAVGALTAATCYHFSKMKHTNENIHGE